MTPARPARSRYRRRLAAPMLLVSLAAALATPPAEAQVANHPSDDQREAIVALASDDPGDRRDAARDLLEIEGPIDAATPYLLRALAVERYAPAFEALVLALGATGTPEAKPPLERYAASRDPVVAGAGRDGLRVWGERTRLRGARADRTTSTPSSPAADASSPGALASGPTLERESDAARVLGINLIAFGGAALMTGLTLLGLSSACCAGGNGGDRPPVIPVATMIGGGVTIALGGGLLHYGSQWVPRDEPRALAQPTASRRVHDVGLTWSF